MIMTTTANPLLRGASGDVLLRGVSGNLGDDNDDAPRQPHPRTPPLKVDRDDTSHNDILS